MRARLWLASVLGGLGLAVACTQDFDSFQIENGNRDASAATGGSAGTGGSGNSTGSGGSIEAGAGQAGEDGGPDAEPDVVCASGQKACLGQCVPEDDPRYGCAAPGCTPCNAANATQTCNAQGECAITSCDPGFEDCDNSAATGCEVNTQQGDPNNCGACRSTCAFPNAAAGCAAGRCTLASCQPNFANCDDVSDNGCETNLLSPLSCGSCTRDCTAQAGNWVCDNGACRVSQCPTGRGDCDTDPATCETDITSSLAHCGFCRNACNLLNATAACSDGQCVVVSCNPGFADCDTAPGCETNLLSNPSHCGACGRACADDNVQSQLCVSGVCQSSCVAGFGNCNQPAAGPDDGCETNLNTSVLNCGACQRACSTANTQGTACGGGVCTSGCATGFGNCSRPVAPAADDGCETATGSDPDNCGACGYVCGGQNVTTRACSGGQCTPSCQTGFTSCNATRPSIDDGCEANTATDVANCGGCGRSCSTDSVGSLSCTAGLCTSTCVPGFANCDQPSYPASDDGCELDVRTNNTSCGGCGNSCSAQNNLVCGQDEPGLCGCGGTNARCRSAGSSGTCSSGVCQCPTLSGSITCQPGEYCRRLEAGGSHECTCNGNAGCGAGQTCCQTPAGCFTLTSDPQNCGACGRACPPGFVCSSGTCSCSTATSCNAGGVGSCNAGVCVCGTTTCPPGRRCQANGQCG